MRTMFDYARPASVRDAIALKSELGADAMFWAGGTDAILDWQRQSCRPAHCIDISRLEELSGISRSDGAITIGAGTTLAALERAAGHPYLAELGRVCKLMCTPGTRSIGTVGGNLCNASPAADLTPALIALDALAVIVGPQGERSVALEDLATGPKTTQLGPAELLMRVEIPLTAERGAMRYRRIDRTAVDIALVSVGASLTVGDDGRVGRARVALGAVGPTVFRAREAEVVLEGGRLDALDLEAAGAAARAAARPISDVRSQEDYRRKMVAVLTRRALADCIDELGEG